MNLKESERKRKETVIASSRQWPGKKEITKSSTWVVGLNSEIPPCHLSNKNEITVLPLSGLVPHFGSKRICIMFTSHAGLDVCPGEKNV